MAEIAVVTGITVTIPGILSAAWSALKFAYDLYGDVDIRRKRISTYPRPRREAE
ncbi:hypothetical protein GYMLUDRAFT_70204 [Collybiopsis luxurians FD-317 M1]|nr:hypothetical protein GYMLUDRAFT_70204 [Collybiopsis luxurians FD-317 M1]